MKILTKMSLAAMAMMVGVGGLAATGNADDHRGPDRHVVVIEKQVVKVQPVRQVAVVRGSLFDRLDINNNGRVSRQEFMTRYGNSRSASRAFSQADINRSGNLGPREVANAEGMLMHMRMRG